MHSVGTGVLICSLHRSSPG